MQEKDADGIGISDRLSLEKSRRQELRAGGINGSGAIR